jgi:hypothetical protein
MGFLEIWSVARPVAVALGLTSTTIILSNSLPGDKKLVFQGSIFALALAASFMFLSNTYDGSAGLQAAVSAFGSLDSEVRLAISIMMISLTYFLGGIYLGYGESSGAGAGSSKTPASCDQTVTFEVPASLPAEDKAVFEMMFDR